VAAIKASQLGLKVALIEKYNKFGGTCLHWGCIPTKALLLNADLYEKALKGKEFGILYKDINLDFRMVRARKNKIVKKLSMGTAFLMKKNKITTFEGKGTLTEPGTIAVEGESPSEVRAKNIIVASGSEAKLFPGIEADGNAILTNKEILDLDRVPKSLLVVGAGAVGVEFASIYSRFGTDVTMVEMLPKILPFEDPEVSDELKKILTKRKIKCLTDARLEEITLEEGGVQAKVSVKGGETKTIKTEKALIAVGRKPITERIGLEKLRVNITRGFVPVNDQMETNVPGIFAIGDVVPTQQLAHLASHEGILAVSHIAGKETTPINYDLVPSCTYCSPEVSSVGLTEEKAREKGYDVVTSRFPFAAIGKASILGESDGFVKLVCDNKCKEILGVHMIGPHVTELIAEGTALIGLEAAAEDAAHLIHAHPTVSEGIMEAAHAIYGAAIHY
jgi:dihydrolipoamide dehydrogenase